MKRVAISVLGGSGIMLIIACCMTFSSSTWLGRLFFLMLAFPVFIFDPLLSPPPNPNDPLSYLPSIQAAWATLIFDLVFYSLLVYLFLRLREKRRQGEARRSSAV
jgi:hypothetical protein